jgi:hypothetical protein
MSEKENINPKRCPMCDSDPLIGKKINGRVSSIFVNRLSDGIDFEEDEAIKYTCSNEFGCNMNIIWFTQKQWNNRPGETAAFNAGMKRAHDIVSEPREGL